MITHKWRAPETSPNFKNGSFQNLSPTSIKADDVSFGKMLLDAMRRPASVKPPAPIPSVRTDLNNLDSTRPTIVWFGHSSYLIHDKELNFLIDPVFSGHASPLPGLVKAFPGSNIYSPEDMPPIDILILTHNHYDHFDVHTVARLKDKVKKVIVPIGVGPAVAALGFDPDKITETDWWETVQPLPDITLTATPARHFSGRGLKRGGSLWNSYVLQLKEYRLYLGGDSGYDHHFASIGEKYGPFDLAILECGQYNRDWPHIHMMPEETAQAAVDLHAKVLLPVHWGKFTLANHPWNEPITRVLAAAKEKKIPVATPLIGQPFSFTPPFGDAAAERNPNPGDSPNKAAALPDQPWWNLTKSVTP